MGTKRCGTPPRKSPSGAKTTTGGDQTHRRGRRTTTAFGRATRPKGGDQAQRSRRNTTIGTTKRPTRRDQTQRSRRNTTADGRTT